MLVYKIDVLEALKEAGYNTTRLRKENILGQSTLQYMRNGEMLGPKALDIVCRLLDMQPGNIIKYVPDQEEEQQKTSRKTSIK
jgi:DNA-binding Xre family transcriptional regulator